MKTLDSNIAYDEYLSKLPKIEDRDIFYFKGHLNPVFKGKEIISDPRLHQTVGKVERIIRDSFSDYQVEGVETPISRPSLDKTRWYSGLVYVLNGESLISTIKMSSNSIRVIPSKIPLRMDAIFPLGEYYEQSQQALEQIWPMIRCLGFGRYRDSEVRARLGIGSVFLIKDENLTATGKAALKESGFGLSVKPIN